MSPNSTSERLRAARIAAGYETVKAAVDAMGANYSTYSAHENGEKGLMRSGARYAKFFRVSLDWLLTGRGTMRASAPAPIPIMGVVTAGQSVTPADGEVAILGEMAWPAGEEVHAFRVIGDSMYPRFLDGELLLVEAAPRRPRDLVNRYALVQLADGRRMIKMLRAGSHPGVYTLESHNAPPERDVELLAAWSFRGLLAG